MTREYRNEKAGNLKHPNCRQEEFLKDASTRSNQLRVSLFARDLGKYADDAIQVAIVKTYTRLDDPDCGIENPEAYMWMIARNEAIDLRKRDGRYSPLPSDLDSIMRHALDPADEAAMPEQIDAIQAEINRLSPRLRAVLVLRINEPDLSNRALGAILGLSESNVKNALNKARDLLREALLRRGFDPPRKHLLIHLPRMRIK